MNKKIQILDENAKRKLAIQFVLLFGIVSAFGDITYEGARSVYGPYLGTLGASAVIVGVITGVSEFFGYLLRLMSGYIADKTQKYWLITILGYAMLISVPLLAVAGRWEIAAVFIVLERIGKAIRSPGKDAMLSHATKQIGTGFGFGIHEALDQLGGIIGPFVFVAALSAYGDYKKGFALMAVPAVLTVATVLFARAKVPNPALLEDSHDSKEITEDKLPTKVFWLYSLFTFVSVSGFIGFPIISYHLSVRQIIPLTQIPLLYAIAMGIDAVVALFIGRIYDRVRFASLAIIPLLTFPIAVLAFSDEYIYIIFSIILWGAVMGIHETIMRAAIADLTGIKKRGTAYGIFNTLYGLAMLIGSAVAGFLYEYSVIYIMIYVMLVQIASLIIFMFFKRSYARL